VAMSDRCRARPIVTKALAWANLTVGIGRSSLKAGDTWTMIGDWTLGLVGLVTSTGASGRPKFSAGRGPTTLFVGAPYISVLADSCSLSCPFLLT
jgi:hypothetical protein